MALFDWNQIYCTGIAIIDEQHQNLFELVNSIHQAVKETGGKERLDSLLKELLEYIFFHFKTEEELMSKYRYPEFQLHRLEHDNLTRNLLELRSKFKNGNMFVSAELTKFLKSWLTIHILQTDMKFVKHLKSVQHSQNKIGVQKNAS